VREHEAEGGGDDEDGKGDEASEPDREERPCRVLRDRERGTGDEKECEGPYRWPLSDRQPELLETVWPGVFAAGDVRAAATKRVAGAVGALAVRFAHQVLQAEACPRNGSSAATTVRTSTSRATAAATSWR
jgi:hypothetical protein